MEGILKVTPEKLRSASGEFSGTNQSIKSVTDEMVIKENLSVWSIEEFENYKKPDNLLFFIDAGNGDLFGYFINNGKVESEEIYVWNHEDSSQRVVAPSLKEFIKGWYSGEISV